MKRESGPLNGNRRQDQWLDNLAAVLTEDLVCAIQNATVLIVDDLDINRRLLAGLLRQENYRVLEARSTRLALQVLSEENVDLVLLDMVMPDMDGLECCRRIRSNRRTELIPVLMLSSVPSVENEIAGIGAGADEFVHKPFHPEVLRTRIRSLLRHKAAVDRLEESETILMTLAQSVEQRDQYTGGHCERLARLSVALGAMLGLPRRDLLTLHRGGYLHDIGKLAIPDRILFKEGSLTEAEWEVMRAHTTLGEQICRPMKSLAAVLPLIRHHHEKWDGTGYPDGLAGENIPLLARVLQCADIYDALTSKRPYKRAFTENEALETIRRETERGWRDPALLAPFVELILAGEEHLAGWDELERLRRSLESPSGTEPPRERSGSAAATGSARSTPSERAGAKLSPR
jgi:putative two-component system response regulator